MLSLFEPTSPLLDQGRVHEPESYNHRNPNALPSDPVRTVVGVHNPSLEAHILPPGPQNSGSCIIVVPGGGHSVLVIGSEGADCVPFFASYGISTVILRERLRVDGYNMVTDAMNDTFQAIRLVRAHATAWGLDPAKIGIMGFSAGAELAAAAAIEYNEWNATHADSPGPAGESLKNVSCRPDFVGLLYPGPTPFQNKESRKITGCTRLQGGGWAANPNSEPDPVRPQIPRDVPPSFIATPSSGDRIHAIWAAEYYCRCSLPAGQRTVRNTQQSDNRECPVRGSCADEMLIDGVPNLEMHAYGNGTHGGGLTYRHGTPLGGWTNRFIEWFEDLGFLGAPGSPTKAAADVQAFAKAAKLSQ